MITEDTFNNILSNKKKAYLQAEEAMTKAENNYDDSIDSYDGYEEVIYVLDGKIKRIIISPYED